MAAARAVRYAVGNPAAVSLLDSPEDEAAGDEWMQSIAEEFNTPVTAFLVRATSAVDLGSGAPGDGDYNPTFRLRWFTAVAEVKICGHATLAASHFLWTSGLVDGEFIEFMTKSGLLLAKKIVQSNPLGTSPNKAAEKLTIELDFPVIPIIECDASEAPPVPETLNGASIVDVQKTSTDQDLIVVLSSAKEIVELSPNFEEIERCAGRGLMVTALAPAGSGFDFFTRFFCPKFGVNEDYVCGSAHCALAPYWSRKLGKNSLIAYMASPRSGILDLQLVGRDTACMHQGRSSNGDDWNSTSLVQVLEQFEL